MTKLRALPVSGAHLRRRAKAGSIKVLPLVGQSREIKGQTRKGVRRGIRDWVFRLGEVLVFQAKA